MSSFSRLHKEVSARVAGIGRNLSSEELPGNSQVKVTNWNVTFTEGLLQAVATADPVEPAKRIIALSVGLCSLDRSIQYAAALFIPQKDEQATGAAGTGIWGLAQTHAYSKAAHGSDLLAIVGGFVGATEDDMQEFLIEKKIAL